MIEYLIGVDGGGTGTRVRLARADGSELAQGQGGPSGLALGIEKAWNEIEAAVTCAFAAASLSRPPNSAAGIGLGLAGVNNPAWAEAFAAANPGYASLVVETDAFTTLTGAHQGRPGAIVAIGTGSVGMVLLPGGERREVGGWGFPSGDEGSGGWIGLHAINHVEQVMDGRQPSSEFARAVIDACGGKRDNVLGWITQANQTGYAKLARLVVEHAGTDSAARAILTEAGVQIARIAAALDPSGKLPLALCGGLGEQLKPYLPPALLARCGVAQGDSASGALHLIERQVRGHEHTGALQ